MELSDTRPIVAFYHSKLAKATTAEQQAKSVIYKEDPKKVKENLLKAELAPQELLEGEHPRLLDEWQIAPQLWDTIRFDVDHRCSYGLIEIKIGGESLINEGLRRSSSSVTRLTLPR